MQIQEIMRGDVKTVTRDTPVEQVAGTMRDTAKDVMSPKVFYCFNDESVEEVLDDMGEIQMRLPVVDRNRSLVGIVSLGDLSRKAAPGKTQTALGGITEHR